MLALAVLCCTTASATLSGNKEASTGSAEEGRGLLERRELHTFSSGDCDVAAFDVLHVDCGGDYPTVACCYDDNDTCDTNDNGAGGSCPNYSYLGCCPR